MKPAYSFRRFILDEMKRLGSSDKPLSMNEFANLLDVAPSTISRMLSEVSPTRPTVEVMLRLAEVTGYSLSAIVEMAYPEVAEETKLSSSARIMAQRFEKMPEDFQRLILQVMNQWISEREGTPGGD